MAGATGNKGTLKNEGKIVIPTHDVEGGADPAA